MEFNAKSSSLIKKKKKKNLWWGKEYYLIKTIIMRPFKSINMPLKPSCHCIAVNGPFTFPCVPAAEVIILG